MREDEWWNEWTQESNDARDRAKHRIRTIGQAVVVAMTVAILGAAALVWFLTR